MIASAFAWATRRLICVEQPQLAGMIARAAVVTMLRAIGSPPTLMLPAGRCAPAPVAGPPDGFPLADGAADDVER